MGAGMSSSIIINHLVVVGNRKNYIANFSKGLNVIYGDSGTGKSGILDLIDYLLGAKKFDLYPEIESAARYVMLDVELNDLRYTIKRELFDPNALIEVFQCAYTEIESYPCVRYIPKYSENNRSDEYGFFSEFLFDALNYASIKIKVSPTKDDSKLANISIRDLLKFCYIPQDDLGSKRFLDSGDYVLETKNSQVFKYIFHSLDSEISDIQQKISQKASQKKAAEAKYATISEFLRDVDFGSGLTLEDRLSELERSEIEIHIELEQIQGSISEENEAYRAARIVIGEIEDEISWCERRIADHQRKLEQFARLKNDYSVDLKKLEATRVASTVIGDVPKAIRRCPLCESTVDLSEINTKFDAADDNSIKNEINTLRKRIREVENFTAEIRNHIDIDFSALSELKFKAVTTNDTLNTYIKNAIAPYQSTRDILLSTLGSITQEKKNIQSKLKIRNQHVLTNQKIEELSNSIDELHKRLERLREAAPSLESIIQSMGDYLKEFLSFVKINTPTGIAINSNRFFPVVRDKQYQEIRSGGLRTLTCIGYFCSFLNESLNKELNHPSLLMIDTVGKYLGKTKAKYLDETSNVEDAREGVSDPSKYKNIFAYIILLAKRFEERNKKCQIILVDNDIPSDFIQELEGYIVAHFDSEGKNGLPIGFIDDARTSLIPMKL